MVGAGFLMLGILFVTGITAFLFREKLSEPNCIRCILKFSPILLPLPFIANSVGWYIAEAGRQPWIVVGLQKTAEAVSPNLSSGEVWLTLIGFTAIYLLLAVVALFTAVSFINRTKITEEVD